MHLVSVLCIPVSSIPTSLSFLKSFCPCFHSFFVTDCKITSKLCTHIHYTGMMYIVDGVHVYKLLMHRSRVNSSLCLEKSGCSQTLMKVGGVLIYKWVEHVPDT